MSRLHEFKYDEKQWHIKGNRIINKSTFESYYISGDLIGLEQITDDIFLIYSRVLVDEWQISRLQLSPTGTIITEYKANSRRFYFLTEDFVLFNKGDRTILYSISENCEIDSINHLISGDISRDDSSFVKCRNIEFLYNKDSEEYPSYLLIDYTLQNREILDEHLQVLLDPTSLNLLTSVYSTLRDTYFTLSDSFTLRNLVEEDSHYIRLLENFYSRKSIEELLSMVQKD